VHKTEDKVQIPAFALAAPNNGLAAAETELRPWGSSTFLEKASCHKTKRIEVNPGHRLSHYRSEHWIVVSGTAKVITQYPKALPHIGYGLLRGTIVLPEWPKR